MSAGGFGRSGRDMQRRLAQHVQNIGRIEAPDAIALQKLDNRRFADALALPGVGASSHSSSGGAEIAFEVKHGGKVAPKLLAHAVCEPVALGAEIIGDARPFAQLNNSGVEVGELPETPRISAQRRRHDLGGATVILGSCDSEAVAKAIHHGAMYPVSRAQLRQELAQVKAKLERLELGQRR